MHITEPSLAAARSTGDIVRHARNSARQPREPLRSSPPVVGTVGALGCKFPQLRADTVIHRCDSQPGAAAAVAAAAGCPPWEEHPCTLGRTLSWRHRRLLRRRRRRPWLPWSLLRAGSGGRTSCVDRCEAAAVRRCRACAGRTGGGCYAALLQSLVEAVGTEAV